MVSDHLFCFGNISEDDMPEVVDNFCELFADDAKLFRDVHLRDEENNVSLQNDLNALGGWSK